MHGGTPHPLPVHTHVHGGSSPAANRSAAFPRPEGGRGAWGVRTQGIAVTAWLHGAERKRDITLSLSP